MSNDDRAQIVDSNDFTRLSLSDNMTCIKSECLSSDYLLPFAELSQLVDLVRVLKLESQRIHCLNN